MRFLFFKHKPELYIKSIWSSWFELPFTLTRSKEYLFRTICAVASLQDGHREHRFTWSVNKIETELDSLKQMTFIQNDKIDIVLEELNRSKNDLKIKFYEACTLIDATVQFLICPQIKASLVRDAESSEQAEDSHSYYFNIGNFEELRIVSPVRFIIEMTDRLFSGEIAIDDNESQYNTLWFMSVLTSSLFREEDEQ